MPTKPDSVQALPDRPASSVAGLEALEPRLLLAGDVTAAVAGGNLIIRGDSAGNHVVIDQAGLEDGRLRITGGDGTTINGSVDPLIVDGVAGSVRAALGRGDDVLELVDAVLPSDLLVRTGRGDDTVLIEQVEVDGDVRVRSGRGADRVRTENVDVAGRTWLYTGGGPDHIWFERAEGPGDGSVFHGNVQLRAGGGDDAVYVRFDDTDPDGDGYWWPVDDLTIWPEESIFDGGRGRDVLYVPRGEDWGHLIRPGESFHFYLTDVPVRRIEKTETAPGKGYCSSVYGNLTLSVSTDKDVYYHGELIGITVTLANSGGLFRMQFPSSVAATILVDAVYQAGGLSQPAFTWLEIPAGGSKTWTFAYDWSRHDLAPGEHIVVAGLNVLSLVAQAVTFRVVPLPPPPTEDVFIDFETLPDGSAAGAGTIDPAFNYGLWGVHFRSISTWNKAPGVQEREGNHLLAVNTCTYPPGFNIVADFDMPVYAVSADVTAPVGETVTMIARDADGEVLAVVESAPAPEGGVLFGPVQVSSDTPIASVEWWPYVENCTVSIDNLQVVVTAP